MPAGQRRTAAERLSSDDATRIAVAAQGLTGGTDMSRMLRQIGAVQLDTISVLARSHELVPYARLGAVGRPEVERAYWGNHPATAFEYSAHATCLMPAEAWPYFAFRRREQRRRVKAKLRRNRVLTEVRARLREGPVTVSNVGGGSKAAGWFQWSAAKIMLEWLYETGEVVCTDRLNWKRVYDLPERVLAPELIAHKPSDRECFDYLVHSAVRAMGVATRRDIAGYYWLRLGDVDAAIARSDLLPVEVAGWEEPAWAAPEALAVPASPASRTTLLSPFDSLIWTRERMQRLFDVVVLLEAYRPAEERVFGYFAMPVLANGAIIGHVDPGRDGTTLVVKRATLTDPGAQADLVVALREAAAWVGCTSVSVEVTTPASLRKPLLRALS